MFVSPPFSAIHSQQPEQPQQKNPKRQRQEESTVASMTTLPVSTPLCPMFLAIT